MSPNRTTRFSDFVDGFELWTRNTMVQGVGAQGWPWRGTVDHEECINTAFGTAIALIRFVFFRVIASFLRLPTPACVYVTLGLYRIDIGVFLARGNGPAYASCRSLFGLPMAMR